MYPALECVCQFGYTAVILMRMKTAISLPNDLFVLANEFAKQRGLSRSELFATAMRTYLDAHRQDNLTERINRACANLNTSLPKELASAARQKLLEAEW